MNPLGLVAAAATFFGIWFGHVAVRKIEFSTPAIWLPALVAAMLGLGLLAFSLFTSSLFLSTALGILGLTALWDAFEFARQQGRVRKGHAPANPRNPRHARILAEYAAATTRDLLKRDPVGRSVPMDEAVKLIEQRESST